MIMTINGLDPGALKNPNMRNALTDKINGVLMDIYNHLYQYALDKLQHDVLGKTDGCASAERPIRTIGSTIAPHRIRFTRSSCWRLIYRSIKNKSGYFISLSRQFFFLITFVLIALASFDGHATILTQKNEHDLVKESELIFEGTVTEVAYRLSDKVDEKDSQIPFTFVKFKIEKILKGKTDDREFITLRFAGGYEGEKTYLRILGIPLFDKGDHDILFVIGNGKRICPLVGWNQGRFRIIDKVVYSDSGEEVWLTDKEQITFGKVHPFKEVISNTIGDVVLEKVSSEPLRDEELKMKGKKLEQEEFMDFIAQMVSDLHTAKELAGLAPVRSVNIDEKLIYKIPEEGPLKERAK